MKNSAIKKSFRIIDHDFFVMIKDRRVRLRLIISFLLIGYVLSYALFDKDTNILPFFYFGFFFVTPLIDYSFYQQKIKNRIGIYLAKGFSLRQLIISKALLIFSLGTAAGIFFSLIAVHLNSKNILNAVITEDSVLIMVFISLFNLWVILISGIIQLRFEIVFPVRLFNILVFIFFVNYNNVLTYTSVKNKFFTLSFAAVILLISLTCFLSGRLSRDKLS